VIDEEIALLRAATANPDDDTLRLAYADWLDEQGGEAFASHAAFTRLQVRRSSLDIFDPDRISLLEEEATLVQKYRRDWNGRIHRRLRLQGLPGKVDARHGLIQSWAYHRGMITQVSVPADGLTTYPKIVFSLGPVESLQLDGWPSSGQLKATAAKVDSLLARLKVLSLVGVETLPDFARLNSLPVIPILDLRGVNCNGWGDELSRLARREAIPKIVLLRVTVTQPLPPEPNGFIPTESRSLLHIIDPFDKWKHYRAWLSNLTGEVLSPLPYHGTTR
jgi:uncharacterized protein (TIGR02996 family)